MNDHDAAPSAGVFEVPAGTGIPQECLQQFEAFARAAQQGTLALACAYDREDECFRTLVCLVEGEGGQRSLWPVATLVEGDPRLRYLPLASDQEAVQ